MKREVLTTCPKCGAQIDDQENFCPECGQKVCTVCICPYTRSLYDCGYDNCLPYAMANLWRGDERDEAGGQRPLEVGVDGATSATH